MPRRRRSHASMPYCRRAACADARPWPTRSAVPADRRTGEGCRRIRLRSWKEAVMGLTSAVKHCARVMPGGVLALLLLLPSLPAPAQGATDAGAAHGASVSARAPALFAAANAYWTREFVTLKAVYQPAQLSVYAAAPGTTCGTGGMIAGPFYCPQDSHVYLPEAYLQQIAQRAGTSADLA